METKLNGLSLFSGVAGIELALNEWVHTKAYCEIDKYACAVLRSRMSEGKIDIGRIYGDIKQLTGKQVIKDCGRIDIITGGFPCVDISNAGKRRGIEAERSGLWFEMARLIGEIRPQFVFVENVSAIVNRGLNRVLGSLSEIGYDAVWTTLRASDVGAPHRRERFFLLGYSKYSRFNASEIIKENSREQLEKTTKQKLSLHESEGGSSLWKETSNVADSTSERMEGLRSEREQESNIQIKEGLSRCYCKRDQWKIDPADFEPETKSYVGRVADGTSFRVDRIKCLGNAVVSLQAKEAFKRLISLIIFA